MRLIDMDNLIRYANNQRDKTVDANDIARMPRIEAVPIKPLAKWLAGYAVAPSLHLQLVCHVEPRGNVLDANAECWERLLRRVNWEGADE